MVPGSRRRLAGSAVLGACGVLLVASISPRAQEPPSHQDDLNRYCVSCHNSRLKTAGLSLEALDVTQPGLDAAVWEKVVRKLRSRMMPPAGAPRPADASYDALVAHLEGSLDRAAAARPNPGRVDTFRRLSRVEYQNAVRDILALDVDVASLLPKDDASHGFDNVSTTDLSPTLLERYLAAAQKVSRAAIGGELPSAASHLVVLPADLTQEDHLDGLPLGSRGGAVTRYAFPLAGTYEIQVRLARDRNENVEGLTEPQQRGTVARRDAPRDVHGDAQPEPDGDLLRRRGRGQGPAGPRPRHAGPARHRRDVPAPHLRARRNGAAAGAGPLQHGPAPAAAGGALLDLDRRAVRAGRGRRHAEPPPRVRSAARRTRPPKTPCARRIVSTLARRAFRRAVTAADIEAPMRFYREGRDRADFEDGIEMALRSVLASTEFLFRIERDPAGTAPQTPYRISDVALASRLSFFLWSSVPDDELLDVAIAGRLSQPEVFERQVRRMLLDRRADALVTNFASQWLYLRNLAAVNPDARQFTDFDDNLRQAFRRETELFVQSIVREDRNVLDLLRANYTFVNERLARHYGIPNVYGSRFRRVTLSDTSERGGLLGHGSVLTVTSYANRTSPVLRGKWVLENIVGSPPPPPPPNVPTLKDTDTEGRVLSMRERMAQHRANPACASCHQLMDPAGLSLENFDAIGRWRVRTESGGAVDAAGGLPDGSTFTGMSGLRAALVRRPDVFVGTLTEKLLTYGLGRGLDFYDAPAVRKIVRTSAMTDYRFSSLVLGIVKSEPFQMRVSQ